jgi:hypothetical protein
MKGEQSNLFTFRSDYKLFEQIVLVFLDQYFQNETYMNMIMIMIIIEKIQKWFFTSRSLGNIWFTVYWQYKKILFY